MSVNLDLYRLMSLKDKLNTVLKSREGLQSQSTKRLFLEFSNLLNGSIYTVSIKPCFYTCMFCENQNITENSYKLSCSHYICSDICFQSLITSQIPEGIHFYEKLQCRCTEKIDRSSIVHLFKGLENFQKAYRYSSDKFEIELECGICNIRQKASQFITLECDHRYCQNCTKTHADELIMNGKIGKDLSCPDCAREINPQIVLMLLDKKTQEKYEKYLILHHQVQSDEVLISCTGKPGVNCDFMQIVSVDREEFNCPECSACFCTRCKLDFHPKISCEQQRIIKNCEDPLIKMRLEDGSMGLCPWCNAKIEKDPKGCKYMTCRSETCSHKNRFFCWDCKKKLGKSHGMHECDTADIKRPKICSVF